IIGQSLGAGRHVLTATTMDVGGHISLPSSATVVSVAPDAPGAHAPVVSASGFNVVSDQAVSFATAAQISANDAGGDSITDFQIYENTPPAGTIDGHFLINGQQQPTGTAIDVTPANLANVQFVGGQFAGQGGTDVLWIRANDGQEFGAWVSFIATTP